LSATSKSYNPARIVFLPEDPARISEVWTLVLLVSRTLLFLLFQLVIAGLLGVFGSSTPWRDSAGWWTVAALLASVVSFFLLKWRFNQEGMALHEVFAFDRNRVGKDILLTVVALIISAPLVMGTSYLVTVALFGDPNAPAAIMFRPLPVWAIALSVLFPVFVGLSELPTYFAYVMPRLSVLTGRRRAAWLLAGFILGAQHVTLPLVLDWKFMLYRLLMFLPFALFLGLVLRWRPRLLPYLMIGHMLLDLSTVALLIMARS
jgi:hypothetical protein